MLQTVSLKTETRTHIFGFSIYGSFWNYIIKSDKFAACLPMRHFFCEKHSLGTLKMISAYPHDTFKHYLLCIYDSRVFRPALKLKQMSAVLWRIQKLKFWAFRHFSAYTQLRSKRDNLKN